MVNLNYAPSTEMRFRKPPIILGGCPRSGTSLLLSIISAHQSIFCIPEETWAFYDTNDLNEFEAFVNKWLWKHLPDGTNLKFDRWCEKTPRNVKAVRNILEYFGPGTCFINIVRDGRDVITSRHPHDPNKYWVEAWEWVWSVSEGLRYSDNPQVLTIRYEDLVLDFDSTMRTICKFIGEPLSTEMLNYHANASVREHSAWFSTVEPISDRSIGRWKGEKDNRVLQDFLNDDNVISLLKKFDYI